MSRSFTTVDAHVHFWDPRLLDYPWLAGVPALNRAWLPADYAAATGAAKVGKMVFVECGCASGQTLDEVAWVSGLAIGESRVKGIVAQVALERGRSARKELVALTYFPLVKGVRRNLQGETDPGFCLTPDFVAGVRLLAEFGFSFDLCIVPAQLPAVTELVRRCPEVRFVLDHGGKPAIRTGQTDPWRRHLSELAALPNVMCKLSGLLTEADWAGWQPGDLLPYVRQTIECFGFDRVMYGGDWPVLTLAGDYPRWQAALDAALPPATESELQKLFQINAETFYHL